MTAAAKGTFPATAPAARRDQGFMYIEVLVSMLLLSFVLLATAPMFILAVRENASASDMTFASTAATDKAEDLKREDYDALVDGSDVLSLRDMTFDRAWTVAVDMPHPGMTTVTVTVTPRRNGDGIHGANRVATVNIYRVP